MTITGAIVLYAVLWFLVLIWSIPTLGIFINSFRTRAQQRASGWWTVLGELDRKLAYVDWARRVTLSALHGSGIQELIDAVQQAWRSARMDFRTPELTRVLKKAFEAHQPPMKQGRTAKLRYAHAGGKLPPRIVIHGSRTDTIPEAYRRYLANRFIRHFRLKGTPVFIDFRDSDNPYKNKKNVLTRRQLEKRKRLKKFTGRRSRR